MALRVGAPWCSKEKKKLFLQQEEAVAPGAREAME